MDILKYFVEERKISEEVKVDCVVAAASYGRLDCLKYLVEEAKVPLDSWVYVAYARYHEHPECVNYLLEKGFQEPTDEEYAQSSRSGTSTRSKTHHHSITTTPKGGKILLPRVLEKSTHIRTKHKTSQAGESITVVIRAKIHFHSSTN